MIVKLGATAPLDDLAAMPRGSARKAATWERLVANAATTQRPVVDLAKHLQQQGFVSDFQSMTTPNALVVTAAPQHEQEVLAAFRRQSEVQALYRATDGSVIEPNARLDAWSGSGLLHPPPTSGHDVEQEGAPVARRDENSTPPRNLDWPLQQVGAPAAWAQGATGAGVVFGSIDTGVDVTHPSLAASYRGARPDGALDDDYNWVDFGDHPAPHPRDYRWHGTHTLGSVVGRTPQSTFGVAPDTRWIAAAGMTPGEFDLVNLLKAVQWMQAPTRADGTAPDPAKAPDVVGMSWWSGKGHQDLFQEPLRNLRAAGIIPVKSMGNEGPNPESGTSPGQFPEVIAVTATDEAGTFPAFASRGPSPLHKPGESPGWKPDYAAPGVNIRSAVPGGRYATWSGTSMAQPHVSGAIALLLSKYPQLTDQQLDQALAEGARDIGATGRDLEFGWGVVAADRSLAAAERMLGVQRPGPAHR